MLIPIHFKNSKMKGQTLYLAGMMNSDNTVVITLFAAIIPTR